MEHVDVDARPHVQGHPAADHPHGERTDKQGYLGKQEVADDIHVAHGDTAVHHGLRKERGYQ